MASDGGIEVVEDGGGQQGVEDYAASEVVEVRIADAQMEDFIQGLKTCSTFTLVAVILVSVLVGMRLYDFVSERLH